MDSPKSSDNSLRKSDVDMGLTTAGLLPEKGEKLVEIYSNERDWDKTKEKWHKLREDHEIAHRKFLES
ncbi:MAG: hypothetical protein ABEK04_00295 [Candidatus Nanohalobium sp.]